jgi:hypothetical protein
MAKLSCAQNVSSQDKLLDSADGRNRSTSESLQDFSKTTEQDDGGLDSNRFNNKFDSALSRSSRHMVPESSAHSGPQQLPGKEQLTQVNAEQGVRLASSDECDSPKFRPIHNTSEMVSSSGRGADDETASRHARCRTRRGTRGSTSAPSHSHQALDKERPCDCPLMNPSRVKELYQGSALVDITGELPTGIQEHFENCIWRGEIGVALTTRLNEVERVQSLTLPEDDHAVAEQEPPSSSSVYSSHRDTSTDPDIEMASPKSEKVTSPKSFQTYLRILPWMITWIVLFAVFCTIIGQYHTPDSTSSLSSEQQQEAEIQQQRVSQWRTFSHIQEYTYTLPWPIKQHLDILPSNATVGKKTTQPLEAHNNQINQTWYEELRAKTILSATNLTIGLIVTANHALDITAICPPVEIFPSPKPSPTPQPQPMQYTSRHCRDSKAIVFVKNLLTCLWFLPIWLLAQKLVESSRMAWLTDGEAKIRIRVAGVVVSFLAAAALGLGTEVAVREIAKNSYGG